MDREGLANELERWRKRARESQLAHYRCAASLAHRARIFGWASAIIAGTIGVIALLSVRYDLPMWARIGIGVASLLGSTLSAVSTVEKPAERATQHHNAGAAYGNEGRAIGLLLPISSTLADDELIKRAEEIKEGLDAIPPTAPTIGNRVWKKLSELTPN